MPEQCEYDPVEMRAAYSDSQHHGRVEVILGANGEWHLCKACAELPEFKRFKVRTAVQENKLF